MPIDPETHRPVPAPQQHMVEGEPAPNPPEQMTEPKDPS